MTGVLSVWGSTAVPKTWGNDWVAQAEKAHMLLSFQKPATVGIADTRALSPHKASYYSSAVSTPSLVLQLRI